MFIRRNRRTGCCQGRCPVRLLAPYPDGFRWRQRVTPGQPSRSPHLVRPDPEPSRPDRSLNQTILQWTSTVASTAVGAGRAPQQGRWPQLRSRRWSPGVRHPEGGAKRQTQILRLHRARMLPAVGRHIHQCLDQPRAQLLRRRLRGLCIDPILKHFLHVCPLQLLVPVQQVPDLRARVLKQIPSRHGLLA
jgi:hypothetical protein